MANLSQMGRRREHSREEFVEAAVKIVDAEGIEALTARRLGADVGVSSTAVYTYFATREHLIGALVDFLSAKVIAGVKPSGEAPRDQLIAIAIASRNTLLEHPRLAPIFVTASSDAASGTGALLAVVTLLEACGLSGDRLAQTYRAIEGYVFGTTIFDLGAAPDHLSLRQRRYQATGHPAFESAAKSNESISDHNEDAFTLGLRALLDGLGV